MSDPLLPRTSSWFPPAFPSPAARVGVLTRSLLDVYKRQMMGFSVNFSFMVPCACGTIALPIALEGKASWRLPVYGFFCALCCGIVAWLFWGTVLAEDLGFWLHFNRL